MDPMQFERTPVDRGAILHVAAAAEDPARLFDRHFWQQRAAIADARGGRGSISYIDAGERQYVLRRYLRGGLAARVSRDRYLWLGEDRTRAFRELRLLGALRDRGLPVPAPVAARYLRRGPTYTAELVTERLPGSRPLAEAWFAGEIAPADWLAVGRCIRRFHDEGVQHADLNAANIMLGADGAVWLLDFDRGRLRAPGGWRLRVLGRLVRSLRKLSRGRPQAAEVPACAELLQRGHDRGPGQASG